MTSFKGAQFPRDEIIFAVFFYVRQSVGDQGGAGRDR
jgi:transposase-like protein